MSSSSESSAIFVTDTPKQVGSMLRFVPDLFAACRRSCRCFACRCKGCVIAQNEFDFSVFLVRCPLCAAPSLVSFYPCVVLLLFRLPPGLAAVVFDCPFACLTHPHVFHVVSYVPVRVYVSVLKVKKKVNGSFSGGQETKELQELHGANINVSRAARESFLEKDDLCLRNDAVHSWRPRLPSAASLVFFCAQARVKA